MEALVRDPLFQALLPRRPRFNVYRALGVHHRELEHSRMLAALFDPRGAHGLGESFLRAFLARTGVPELARGVLSDAQVFLERDRIDIVIDLPSAGFVVGVENKIHAGEQADQLRRYQASLTRRHHHRQPLMIFLTPTGRPPTTADEAHPAVGCVTVAWGAVRSALCEVTAELSPSEPERWLLLDFARHIQEDIMDEGEAKSAARELWRAHRAEIMQLIRYRPRLEEICDAFVEGARGAMPGSSFAYYPASRGDLREIKLTFPEWQRRGAPLTIMLYLSGNVELELHLLVWSEHYAAAKASLRDLALAAAPGLNVDPDYPPAFGGNYWRQAVAPHTLRAQSFDQASVLEAVEVAKRWHAIIEAALARREPQG